MPMREFAYGVTVRGDFGLECSPSILDSWVDGSVTKLFRTAEPEERNGNRESDLRKPISARCGLRVNEDELSQAIADPATLIPGSF